MRVETDALDTRLTRTLGVTGSRMGDDMMTIQEAEWIRA